MSSFVPFKINKRPKQSESPTPDNGNLHVRVVEAVGLYCNHLYTKNVNLYCKISLQNGSQPSNPDKAFKTDSIQKEMNPIFNISTSLNVDQSDFSNATLQIGIFDHGILQSLPLQQVRPEDNEIGIASLSLSHFTKNKVFQGWIPVRSSDEFKQKQNKKQNNNSSNDENDPQTENEEVPKKKSGAFFSNKTFKRLSDKVGSNKTLNTAYQNATKVATSVATQVVDHATTVAKHVANQATKVSQQSGKTQRDSARLYVVVSFDDTQPSLSSSLLQIVNTPSSMSSIQVFASTFNTGNCSLSDFNQSLSDWLPNDGSIDVYVLGFQELNQKEEEEDGNDDVDEKKEMTESQFQEDDQQTIIEGYFAEYLTDKYSCVSHRNMWQTRLFIFAKQQHANVISNVVSDFVASGLGGIGPNKGGVGISFDFDGVSLCFLSCHLAAHQTKIKERNVMYSKICKQARLGLPKQSLFGQFHCLIMMGDLNYRIDVNGQQHADTANPEIHAKTCQMIEKKSFSELLKHDQLNTSRKVEDAFVGFKEAAIDFAPTFKMERESGMKYISKRVPAWCDRILWRCRDGYDVEVSKYRTYEEVSISDHKPVSCLLNMPIWTRACGIVDEYKKAEIQLKEVSAQDLIIGSTDANAKTDPYIDFAPQLLLEGYVQTNSVYDCDPVSLPLRRNNVTFLEHSALMYQIRDREQRQLMDMNVIGCGYIELRECAQKVNQWIPFEQPISSNGRKAGNLKGLMKLILTV